jgi:hypothetical protein
MILFISILAVSAAMGQGVSNNNLPGDALRLQDSLVWYIGGPEQAECNLCYARPDMARKLNFLLIS